MSRNPYNLAKQRKRERGEAASAGVAALAAQQTIAGMLAEGVAHHRAGRLGEAERLYRRILEMEPEHADGLHLLGMVALQAGRDRKSVV